MNPAIQQRVDVFCKRFGIELPVLLAPMAGACPVQRGLTAAMRAQANTGNRIDAMQAWAGQSAWMARRAPAADILRSMWAQAKALL